MKILEELRETGPDVVSMVLHNGSPQNMSFKLFKIIIYWYYHVKLYQSQFLELIFEHFVCVFFFFKILLNLLHYCFCFMICFLGLEACGVLDGRPGIEPTPSALKG